MPEIRYFKVTQIRTVNISAPTISEAAVVAERAFGGVKKPEDQLNVNSEIREVSLLVEEDDWRKK